MPHFQNCTLCNSSSCSHTLVAGGVKGIFWVPKGTPHTFRSKQQKEWGKEFAATPKLNISSKSAQKEFSLSWMPAAGQKTPLGISEFSNPHIHPCPCSITDVPEFLLSCSACQTLLTFYQQDASRGQQHPAAAPPGTLLSHTPISPHSA